MHQQSALAAYSSLDSSHGTSRARGCALQGPSPNLPACYSRQLTIPDLICTHRRQNLTHVPTRVAFSGHLGHLSSTQEKALNDFKAALEEHGYYTPAKGDDTPASVDDVTLV